LAAIALVSIAARAEDRFEIYGDYSYLHFSPSIAGMSSRSFNGGGAGVTLYFLKIFGIKADFQGYGSTTFTRTYNGTVVLPGGGTIPAGSYTSQGNMFTYLAGPELRLPIPKVKPFVEVLVGGSYTNAYVNFSNVINHAGGSVNLGNQHPFTMAAGGGLDVDVSKRLAIRLGEIDYVLSRYSNPLTSTNNQNNLRYCGGLILKF
jgi:hypothetical protein